MREDRCGAGGWLGFLTPAGHAGHAAELASKWTSVARVMHDSPIAEECPRHVLLRLVKTMVWHPGIIGGRANGAVFRVHDHPEIVFIRNSGDGADGLRSKSSIFAKHCEQFEDSIFALRAHQD